MASEILEQGEMTELRHKENALCSDCEIRPIVKRKWKGPRRLAQLNVYSFDNAARKSRSDEAIECADFCSNEPSMATVAKTVVQKHKGPSRAGIRESP